MSANIVDLTKKVAVVLEKRKLAPTVKAQVGFSIDISGSIQGLYLDGTMETIISRIQAIANKFDDNQTLDMFAFHTEGFELVPATPDMFGSYVKNHVLNHPDLWGGTKFAPVLGMIKNRYFSKIGAAANFFKGLFSGTSTATPAEEAASNLPVYLLFLTDGDTADEGATASMITELSKNNIYIQFVAIGKGSADNFKFIRGLAKEFAHVGFSDFSDPSKVSDEQMYESLLSEEFVSWIKNVK